MNAFYNNRSKGDIGESKAIEYLERIGYTIIKRNFHFSNIAEIDIIAEDNDVLVFIEVKSRYSDEFGSPLESITPRKVQSLRKAAEGYLYVNKITEKNCRFDIISIRLDMNNKLEHIREAF